MLSLFPSLLSWNQLAPTIIRIVLGAVFIYGAYKSLKNPEVRANKYFLGIGIVEGIIGILLFVGLFTQGAALAGVVDLIVRLAYKVKNRAFLTDGVNYYVILLAMALSLIFTGAGLFAFDYPL